MNENVWFRLGVTALWRKVRPTFLLAALGCASLGFLSCSESPTGDLLINVGPASIMLAPDSLSLFPSETASLTLTVRDLSGKLVEATVSWSSSNPAVAVVTESGAVRGVTAGTVTIEASVDTLTAGATVRVVEPLGMAFPLVGALNMDFFYTHHFDHDPTGGLADYSCGVNTIDGHRGTDIALLNLAKMDSGVVVRAAAAGIVDTMHDGELDRNLAGGFGGLGNFVRIRHRDEIETIYGQLAKGSIGVSAGDSVAAGTPIGLVGSSGNSYLPHLHLEFRRDGAVYDPFSGLCGSGVTQWAIQDAYQDSFMVLGSGVAGPNPITLNMFKDPPLPVDTFLTTDNRAIMWVQLYNVERLNVSTFDLYSPSGDLFFTFPTKHEEPLRMSWWYAWRSIDGAMTETGTWRYEYSLDGEVLVGYDFELVAAVQDPDDPPAAQGRRSRGEETGGGGGGF